MVNCIASKHRGMQASLYKEFEIVMTQEHQDAWDEFAAEQLALAKAEMEQRSPEEQARRDKAFWEKFRKGEIVSAEIVEDEDLKTEIRWCYLYLFGNRATQYAELSAQFGLPIETIMEIIHHPTTWDCMKTLNDLPQEEHHRLYLKYKGPLAQGCVCAPCEEKKAAKKADSPKL